MQLLRFEENLRAINYEAFYNIIFISLFKTEQQILQMTKSPKFSLK